MVTRDELAKVVHRVLWEGDDEDHTDCTATLDEIAAADALMPLIELEVAKAKADALREAADDLDKFAATAYGEDVFQRPTSEQYREINALLKPRYRDGVLACMAADAYFHAITVQATRLRERAEDIEEAS